MNKRMIRKENNALSLTWKRVLGMAIALMVVAGIAVLAFDGYYQEYGVGYEAGYIGYASYIDEWNEDSAGEITWNDENLEYYYNMYAPPPSK